MNLSPLSDAIMLICPVTADSLYDSHTKMVIRYCIFILFKKQGGGVKGGSGKAFWCL